MTRFTDQAPLLNFYILKPNQMITTEKMTTSKWTIDRPTAKFSLK
jgi:hypothetical protein